MFEYSADEVCTIVQSENYDLDYKYRVITELKAHIKRDFVDLSQVPGYFEALKVGNKNADFKLSSLAFSSICHLVKRVGMQDPTSLRNSSKIVLPILVNRLLDAKSNFKIQAKSSLETFWLATPSIVELYVRDTALIHSNPRVRAESIVFISDLIELNKKFDFLSFLPNLVNLLRDDSIDVVKNVEVLVLKYFTFNKMKLNELIKEFKKQKIEAKKAVKILRELDPAAANSYATETKPPSKPTIDTFSNLTRPKYSLPSTASQVQRTSSTLSLSSSKELSDILSKIETAQLDDSITPIPVHSADGIQREVEKLLPPFQGKETEFNWNNREKNIQRFRGLVVANSEQYPDELVSATRVLFDGISKAITSLRTTLSSNGCQLVKELAVYLTKNIDPVAENLFQPLASLTSATKKIASLNSFGSSCVLLTNTSFNNRLFNQCFSLYQEKNVQPRLYSSTFLQIYLLKHGSRIDQSHLETIGKWLGKGVADPNTAVRESMRSTFWIFYKRFREQAETLYAKLDANAQKNLERSRPKNIESLAGASQTKTSSNVRRGFGPEKKRQSIRELVAAKQREKRSTSGPQLTSRESQQLPTNDHSTDINSTATAADLGRPGRIGIPQRVRAVSNEFPPLQRQLSRGSTQHQRHHSHQLSVELTNHSSGEGTIEFSKVENTESDDEIEHLVKLLKSPLTRERIEGVSQLKQALSDDSAIIPDLSSALFNLIILDTLLLKPLLAYSRFYDLIDISLGLKVLAVNKGDLSVAIQALGAEKVLFGLCSMVKSLESLKFDNAPSTMFHIKYKNLFLDFGIQSIYSLLTSEDGASLSQNLTMFKDICQVVLPLCISDYPKYDELVLHLNSHQPEIFQEVLNDSTAYIKSKINSILDEFQDNNIAELNHDNSFTDHGLKDMTMINPLNKNANDPTVSVRAGFSTDMTMIMPNLEAVGRENQSSTEQKDREEGMDIDDEEGPKTDVGTEPLKVDYMSDIFNPSKESTKNIEITDDDGKNGGVATDNEDQDVKSETHTIEASQSPRSSISASASPFLDNFIDDKIDPQPSKLDEATENLTNQINDIYISPEKPMFKAPENRESLINIIDQASPFFSEPKKHIEIFEDFSSKIEQTGRRLIDFELAKFDVLSDDHSVSVESIKNLLLKIRKDEVNNDDFNYLIKALHQLINDENISNWIKESGFRELMAGLIHFFNWSANITKQLCFKGLIVFKELLVVSEFLDNLIKLDEVLSIWSILIMIVGNLKDFKNEIFISVDELVDDLLGLNIAGIKLEITKDCCISLKEQKEHMLLTLFYLLTMAKCIETEYLSIEQIKDIDSAIFRFLSSSEVEIRRLTIIIYSQCKRNLQELDQNSNTKLKPHIDEKQMAQDTYNAVFQKLSLPQRKLVDYYCGN